MKNADPQFGGGLYCGPLRLLALEIFEKLNKEGVHCNLLTGQEHQEVPFATHQSSTVEMVSLDKPYDVVVIDEIQMIADDSRGWAWYEIVINILFFFHFSLPFLGLVFCKAFMPVKSMFVVV